MGNDSIPPSSVSWVHADFARGNWVIRLPGLYPVSLPLYPVSLLILHGVVFSITFPLLDLPVADDANYFGSGKQFFRFGDGLNADWTPILTYFSSLLHTVLPGGWYGRFAVYSFSCRLFLLWGIYGFTRRFTEDRPWAFVSTVVAATCFSYWIHMNGRAFASGVFLLLLAWMNPRRPLDLFSLIAMTAIAYLLRPEFILVCGGLSIYAAWQQYRQHSWKALLRPTRATFLRLALGALLWLPIVLQGKIGTQRLSFAFAQFFQNYVVENDLLDSAGLTGYSGWNECMDAFFPPDRRDRDSWWCRILPLYEIVSANPSIFLQFVAYNTEPFLNAEIVLSRSPALSKFLNDYMIGSLFLFLIALRDRHRWNRAAPILFFSLVFLFSIAPCLITRPFRDYIYAPLIWFFCVIPYFVWPSSRFRYGFSTVLFTVALLVQYPGWQEIVRENRPWKNWNRAQVVGEAARMIPLRDAVIAECYPIFCTAFNDDVKRSVHYPLQWDNADFLRAYGDKGIRVDYVLLEAVPPKHLLAEKKKVREWMDRWGEKIIEKNGYGLWKVNRRVLVPTGEIRIADDEESTGGFRDGSDEDWPDRREIVIRWNFGDEPFRDFHVYVSVDGGDYTFLGRAGGRDVRQLVWKPDGRLLAPAFQQGPEFGHLYRFRIYGIPRDDSEGKPKILSSEGTIEYSQVR